MLYHFISLSVTDLVPAHSPAQARPGRRQHVTEPESVMIWGKAGKYRDPARDTWTDILVTWTQSDLNVITNISSGPCAQCGLGSAPAPVAWAGVIDCCRLSLACPCKYLQTLHSPGSGPAHGDMCDPSNRQHNCSWTIFKNSKCNSTDGHCLSPAGPNSDETHDKEIVRTRYRSLAASPCAQL